MMKTFGCRSILISFALAFAAPAFADPMEVTPLEIQSGDEVFAFSVEVANDPDEISFGLMERTEIAEDAGMLFDFGNPRETSMWMKNTILPLDMLFIDSDGSVEMIARNTVPGSLRTISPGIPVKAVLELNAGTATRLGIEPGDVVVHPIFNNDAG